VLATYPGIDIGKITQRNFMMLLEQAPNITSYRLNGKLENETERDRRKRLKEQYLNG